MKKAVPWIFGVICVVRIQEHGPLISSHLNLAIGELHVSPGSHMLEK